jgi:TetR/AcrR family transcriptional regulator
MASIRPGQRKLQIIEALAAMLAQPRAERITTAALAARLALSEAALYRHFASKAQMFEGLIDVIETRVFGAIDAIAAREARGLERSRAIVALLLGFAAEQPGMARVLIGEALVGEDERLHARMNQFYARLEGACHDALRLAAAQGDGRDSETAARASVLVSYVTGRWHRYVKSGLRQHPADPTGVQLALLLGPCA